MSKSNPMHHEQPYKAPVNWPFPREPIEYADLPPHPKPVKEKPVLPDDEPPF